jgi:intein/homing endonuclease
MDLNKLALFLGMLIGDGYISNRKNGFGYPTYSINFYNTNQKLVVLFAQLFYELFDEKGKINSRKREGRKIIYDFCKHSKEIFDYVVYDIGIPFGKKASIVEVPDIIFNSNELVKKYFLLGLFYTDGGVNKRGNVIFHMASKELLLGVNVLFNDLWKINKEVKRVTQKNKYISYQLNLNIAESTEVLQNLPGSHNLVLHRP